MSLTDERIAEIWNGMPDGHDGFCKSWGYVQFAREIAEAVLCKPEKRSVFFGDGQQIWTTATFPISSLDAAMVELKPRIDEYLADLQYLNDGSECD